GRTETHLEAYPLEEVRELAERSFRAVAIERGLDFTIDLAPGLPPSVVTDRQLLDQILKNLLSNAFKFTERGRVELRVHRAPSELTFRSESLRHARGVIAFSVSDTGI